MTGIGRVRDSQPKIPQIKSYSTPWETAKCSMRIMPMSCEIFDRFASRQPTWVAGITSCLLQPPHNSSIQQCTGNTVTGRSLEQQGAAAAYFQHIPGLSTMRTLNSNYVPSSMSSSGQNEPKSIFMFFQLSSTRHKFGHLSTLTNQLLL